MNKIVLVLKKFFSPSGEKNTNHNRMVVRAVVDPSSTKHDGREMEREGMSASCQEDDAQTES